MAYFPTTFSRTVHSFPADLYMLNSNVNMDLILNSLFCSIVLFAILMPLLPYHPSIHSNLAKFRFPRIIIPKYINDLHIAKSTGYFSVIFLHTIYYSLAYAAWYNSPLILLSRKVMIIAVSSVH